MPNEPATSSDKSLKRKASDQARLKRTSSMTSSTAGNMKQSGSTAKRYKSLLTCSVCSGDAHGYNFDAISCESCKAFFRRNALQPDKLKCRGGNHCDVSHTMTKRCKKCRLEKCLRSGMRKEWILTDKERDEKRTKIEENRRLRQVHNDNEHHPQPPKVKIEANVEDPPLGLSTLIDPTTMNDFDWFMIRFYQVYYTEAVKLNEITGIACYPSVQPIESTFQLFCVPLYISAMRLISFIKQTNEFQELSADDQVYLVKSNLLVTCFFHSMFIYDPRTDCYHESNTSDPLFSGKDWVKTLNRPFHLAMKHLRNELIDIFQLDDIIIKLFFLILLFSTRMSLPETSRCTLAPPNTLDVFKAQNIFVELVYKYCVNQYGSTRACLLFSRYIHKLMKLQGLVDDIKFGIADYLDIEQVSPLMQSLLMG